jgi:hypothetical protein
MKGKIGFSSLNAKDDVAYRIAIISKVEHKKMYEIIEQSVKATFPEYFESITPPETCE